MKTRLLHWQRVVMVALLVAFLAGCGEHTEPMPSANSTGEAVGGAVETNAPDTQPETMEQIVNDLFGSMDDGVYTNDALGVGCRISSDWTYYTEDEIAELNQTVVEMLSDPDVAMVDPDDLDTINCTVMFAGSSDGLANANITMTRLSVIEAYTLTEDVMADAALEQVLEAYGSMGFTNCTGSTEVRSILGGEHPVVIIEAYLNDIVLHQTEVVIKNGRYFGFITATSYIDDITDDILSWFYTI